MQQFLWSLAITSLLLGGSVTPPPATALSQGLSAAEPYRQASVDSLHSRLIPPQSELQVTVDSTHAEAQYDIRTFDQPEDLWFSPDKFLHAGVSFLITLSAQYTYEQKLDMPQLSALPLSMLSASLVGIGKEVYDWQWGPREYFSAKDIVANSVGILFATLFILWV